MYLQTDLQTYDLRELPTKFDVILVEPPLEEYQHTGVNNVQFWDWQKIMDLDIAQVNGLVWLGNVRLFVLLYNIYNLYFAYMNSYRVIQGYVRSSGCSTKEFYIPVVWII